MIAKHMIGSVHRDSPDTPQSTGFCCVALRASTTKECEEIVCRIGETAMSSYELLVPIFSEQAYIYVFVFTATGFKHTEWFV